MEPAGSIIVKRLQEFQKSYTTRAIMECPFLESGIPDCGEVLNMGNLSMVFDLCMNRYVSCPVYQRLRQAVGQEAEVAQSGARERRENCRV